MVDFYVSPSGGGTACSLASPCELQYALDQADLETDDVTVHLAAGTYDGGGANFSYVGCFYSITLVGAGASSTFVQSGSSGADALWLGNGLGITVSGISFQNSNAGLRTWTEGCGLDHPLVINDCQFISNQQGLNIQHDYIEGATTLSNNVFQDNDGSENGAGLFIVQYTNDSPITLSNNVFMQNATTSSGGGVYLFLDPQYFGATDSLVTISGNTFTQNTSSDMGGGIFLELGGELDSLIFDANWLDQNSAGAGGAGQFNFNEELNASPLFINNIITNNESTAGSGGGLDINNADTNPLDFINNTLVGNSSTQLNTQGGGIYLTPSSGAPLNFYNNIFWDNEGDAQDLYISNADWDAPASAFENNDFQQICVLSVCSSGSDVSETGFGLNENNISSDPLFVATGDEALYYLLAQGSPAIAAGNSEILSLSDLLNLDFDEKARPTPAIHYVDLGALQYQGPTPALSLTIQSPSGDLVEGGEALWTFIASSANADAENVTLTLQFSDNQEYLSSVQASLSIRVNAEAVSCTGSGTSVICSLGTIAVNTPVSLSVNAKILAAGTLTVSGSITDETGASTASSTGSAVAISPSSISGGGCALNKGSANFANALWIYGLSVLALAMSRHAFRKKVK